MRDLSCEICGRSFSGGVSAHAYCLRGVEAARDGYLGMAEKATVLLMRARNLIYDLEMCPGWAQEAGQTLRVEELDPFLDAHLDLIPVETCPSCNRTMQRPAEYHKPTECFTGEVKRE